MPRYIDADIAQAIADEELTTDDAGTVQHILQHTVTADVRKVEHGTWIKTGTITYKCSLCENLSIGNKNRFCPMCGARMECEI